MHFYRDFAAFQMYYRCFLVHFFGSDALVKNGHMTQKCTKNTNCGCVFIAYLMLFPLISTGICIFGMVFKTSPKLQHAGLF